MSPPRSPCDRVPDGLLRLGPADLHRPRLTECTRTKSSRWSRPTVRFVAGKVLEVDRDQAVIEVYSGTRGLDLATTRVRPRWGRQPRIGVGVDAARPHARRSGGRHRRRAARDARGLLGRQRAPDQPGRPALPIRVHRDRHLCDRRPEHPGARPEAADLLRLRTPRRRAGRRISPHRRRVAGDEDETSSSSSPRWVSPIARRASSDGTSRTAASWTAPCSS